MKSLVSSELNESRKETKLNETKLGYAERKVSLVFFTPPVSLRATKMKKIKFNVQY